MISCIFNPASEHILMNNLGISENLKPGMVLKICITMILMCCVHKGESTDWSAYM